MGQPITLDTTQFVVVKVGLKTGTGARLPLPANSQVSVANPEVCTAVLSGDGKTLIITGLAPGSAQVTVTSPAPAPSSLTLDVTVTLPQITGAESEVQPAQTQAQYAEATP
jgi:hypothetical protein